MKKQGAFNAWKMLVMSFPKGIASFVVAVAGLSVSLPLSVFLVGLPLLALTFVMCRRMMEAENRYAGAWIGGARQDVHGEAEGASRGKQGGWRSMLSVLGSGRSYRGLLYSILQLPVGIAAFTTAVVLPVTSFAVLLSPLAYEVGVRFYSFELFADPWVMDKLLPTLPPYQRSWVAGGAGALLVLLLPLMLRVLARFYASWVQEIAAEESQPVQPAAASELQSGGIDHDELIRSIEARLNL